MTRAQLVEREEMRCATGELSLNETDSATKSYTKVAIRRYRAKSNRLSKTIVRNLMFRVKYITETAPMP